MKIHSKPGPGLAVVLAIALPVWGVVGCQAVMDMLRDPDLPSDVEAAQHELEHLAEAVESTPAMAAKMDMGAKMESGDESGSETSD